MAVASKKRNKKFVDGSVQGALVTRLALHWFTFVMVGFAVSIVFQFFTDPFRPISEHMREMLQNQAGFLLVMLCMTPIYLFDTVKLSNRFVGPILRLRRAMKDLGHGRPTSKIKFRPGDFWMELADDFNLILDRTDLASTQEASDKSEDQLQETAS